MNPFTLFVRYALNPLISGRLHWVTIHTLSRLEPLSSPFRLVSIMISYDLRRKKE